VQVGSTIGSLYADGALGVTDQIRYLNQFRAVETNLEPDVVFVQTQAIEQEIPTASGLKVGASSYSTLIFPYYDQLILQTDTLTIPHPYSHQRRFTLVLLVEIAPDFVHPKFVEKRLLSYLRSVRG